MNADAELIDNDREVEVTGPADVAPTNMALISAISKAELDQQITTARAYPRSLKTFVNECRDMACLNEKVARECYYSLPARRGGDGEKIEGPSIRLGEIVQSAWGNCQSGARIVDEGKDFLTAQGVFFDLERNVRVTMEVRRRITNKEGKRFSADMIGVTGNAACSIALRNAIFRGIPKAFWSDIYEEARQVSRGDLKSLDKNRADALAWLLRKGVTEQMVLDALGKAGVADIGLDELETLRGMVTSIKDGEATIETVFAPKQTREPQKKQKPKTEKPKGKKKAPADAPQVATPEGDKGSAPVSADQLAALIAKADEGGIPLNALCAKYEIGVLADLPAKFYDAAVKWLVSVNAPPP